MKLYIEHLKEDHGMSDRGPYTKLSVRSGGAFYSCFKGAWNSHWKAGMEIDVEIDEKIGKNGKIYKNIKPPPRSGFSPQAAKTPQGSDLSEINQKLDRILAILKANFSSDVAPGEDTPF